MVPTPILILAFQDPEAMASRIKEACSLGLTPIYVSVDGTEGKSFSDEVHFRNRRCVEVAMGAHAEKSIEQIRISDTNLGQAIAIPSAIDWFFSMENSGVILEEDCSLIHFEDLRDALKLFPSIMEESEVIAISLSNLWPEKILSKHIVDNNQNFILTNFFNSWGWYTNSTSWGKFDQDQDEQQMLWKGIRKSKISVISKLILFLEWKNHIIRSRKRGKQTWALRFTLHALHGGGCIAVPRQNFIDHQPSPFSEHVKQRPSWAVDPSPNTNANFRLLAFKKVSRPLESYTAKNIHGASVLRLCQGIFLYGLSRLKIVKR
jgi:hypothetical protein